MRDEHKLSNRHIARLIAFGVVLYAVIMNLPSVGHAFSWLLNLLAPVLLGLTFALILNVPMHGFQRLFARIDRREKLPRRLRNMLSLLLAVIAVPLLLFVLIRFIVPQCISAVNNVIAIVEGNLDKISAFAVNIGLDPNAVADRLTELGNWASQNIARIAGTTLSAAMSIFSSVADVLLAIILAIYVLADKDALARRARRTARALLPDKVSDYICRCAAMFVATFRTFLSLQCLEAVILGALILICMLIFRIPYAVTISCMTAMLALIPYIGAYVSLAIGCVLVITISPMKALAFAIIFLVAQQVEGNLIYPRVVGRSVGLPAYVTLAAVMVGGALAGIPGMFFIIPVISVFYVLLREIVQQRNAEKDARLRSEKP